MPENEFEKKVSSEMQKLKFAPSEKVWPRVEERIRKKNKRRVFVIIFLLAGLALLGYWQRDNLFGEKKTNIVTIEKQKQDNAGTQKDTNNTSAIKQNTETIRQEEAYSTNNKKLNNKTIDERSIVDKKVERILKGEPIKSYVKSNDETKIRPVPEKTKSTREPEASIDVTLPTSQKNNPVNAESKIKDTIADGKNTESSTKQDEIQQPEVTVQKNKIDSARIEQKKDSTKKTDTLLQTEPAKVPAAARLKKDSSGKKWKWGLHLTPGISSLNNNSISFNGLESADALNYQNQAGSGSGVPPARQKPSDVKPGFAFQAGAFAQRQLSPRTGFSLGLQYGYYSNVIGIGNRRDSLVRATQFLNLLDEKDAHIYNAGGDTVKFTNRYHFIELPLQFQWQLNKSITNPFVWSTGFTLGQLIVSNALMYDTAFNGIYYKNNKLLNKTQISLSTGFSWTIANGKRAQWSLGPVANIHLNKLVDNPFESKKYLFFAGFRTSILFNHEK